MQILNSDISVGFCSQYEEVQLDELCVEGKIPAWLSGYFISNGPGQYEVGLQHFQHWFDGFAMLKKFTFQAGTVSFQNRFLHSREYKLSHKLGRLNTNEFATYAQPTVLGGVRAALVGLLFGDTHDNCLVHTASIANEYIALTEGNNIIAFDIQDLSTTGHSTSLLTYQATLPSLIPILISIVVH